MEEILNNFLGWSWELITGLQVAINWLFTYNETISNLVNILVSAITGETSSLQVAPIYLIGGGVFVFVLIAGIIRAIV